MILPSAILENTRKRAEQLRQGIKQVKIEQEGQTIGKITLSLGVACFPEHSSTQEDLLRSADLALYRAKTQGRDQVVCASSSIVDNPQ